MYCTEQDITPHKDSCTHMTRVNAVPPWSGEAPIESSTEFAARPGLEKEDDEDEDDDDTDEDSGEDVGEDENSDENEEEGNPVTIDRDVASSRRITMVI